MVPVAKNDKYEVKMISGARSLFFTFMLRISMNFFKFSWFCTFGAWGKETLALLRFCKAVMQMLTGKAIFGSDYNICTCQCPAKVDIKISRKKMKIWFSLFKNWNKNLIHSFWEVKSEMKMLRDRDQEVKFLEKSFEKFPPLAFECIVVLPPSLMAFFASFNFLHAICWI